MNRGLRLIIGLVLASPCALAAQAPATVAVSAEQLIGRWSAAEDCREGTTFRADGTYSVNDGDGRWQLSGANLTMVLERPPRVQPRDVTLGQEERALIEMDGSDTLVADFGWTTGGYGMKIAFTRCG